MRKKTILIVVLVSLVSGSIGGVGTFFAVKSLAADSIMVDSNEQRIPKEVYVEDSPIIEAIDKANPAVVSIIASKELQSYVGGSPFGLFGFPFGDMQYQEPETVTEKREIGGGTGFIVREDGLAVTNRHVVEDDEAEYSVFLPDGKKLFAEVLAKDTVNDIAVVQLYEDEELKEKASDLPVVQLGDSDKIRVGSRVVAIGNALSEFDNTTTAGIVSGKGRQIVASSANGRNASKLSGLIQTDASINPGNSGGPLINVFGEVIGINTAVAEANGIGFAIPINDVRQVIESVEEFGRIVRPYLGVRYIEITPELATEFDLPVETGAYLQDDLANKSLAVLKESPADKAGLKSGDIIVSIDGNEIKEGVSLQSLIAGKSVGDRIEVGFYRDGELNLTNVELEEMPTS